MAFKNLSSNLRNKNNSNSQNSFEIMDKIAEYIADRIFIGFLEFTDFLLNFGIFEVFCLCFGNKKRNP